MISWRSRDELPFILNSMGLTGAGVEVGTQRGHFAEHLRRYWHGDALVCVDPWAPYPGLPSGEAEHEECMKEAFWRTRNAAALRGKQCTMLRATSVEGAAIMAKADRRLDFVYIDADHEYASVKADIAAWLPLVKIGGIVAGHDFVPDGWHRHGNAIEAHATREAAGDPASLFGVTRAVYESFRPEEIVLTSPHYDGGWRSWLVVKR